MITPEDEISHQQPDWHELVTGNMLYRATTMKPEIKVGDGLDFLNRMETNPLYALWYAAELELAERKYWHKP